MELLFLLSRLVIVRELVYVLELLLVEGREGTALEGVADDLLFVDAAPPACDSIFVVIVEGLDSPAIFAARWGQEPGLVSNLP